MFALREILLGFLAALILTFSVTGILHVGLPTEVALSVVVLLMVVFVIVGERIL